MLKGKNIVITGSNRGIGFAIAEKCIEYGASIWACMRSLTDENLQQFERLPGWNDGRIQPTELDLDDEECVTQAAKQILSAKKPIHAIINNAGIVGCGKPFAMTPLDEIKHVFDVNFFAPLLFTQKLLRNMIRNKQGSIVNLSSVAAFDGKPSELEYVASKAAVIGATRRLAEELGSFGIRVNAIAPGVTETEMLRAMNVDAYEKAIGNSFLKKPAQPQDIAELAAFLASDRSAYITGQVIRADGGGN